MTTLTIPELLERIEYPESDGLPMSNNTEQWDWMMLIKEGLEALFINEPHVFVAGNLLWYAVEGDNRWAIEFCPVGAKIRNKTHRIGTSNNSVKTNPSPWRKSADTGLHRNAAAMIPRLTADG